MGDKYPYSVGDLIEEPNNYYYSPFDGEDFLISWRKSRQQILLRLPEPISPPEAGHPKLNSRKAQDLLDIAYTGHWGLRMQFLKKFEIFKRVHHAYDEKFRAIDIKECKNLALYLRLADVFERSYSDSQSLVFLNVLLKCIDTICAYNVDLTPSLQERFAWHLVTERRHVDRLARQVLKTRA